MSVHNVMALKSANGFASEIGVLVKRATEETLVSPDWDLNTSICDLCRFSLTTCENAVISFVWRLKEPREDVILLTLSLIDLCMKSCENTFPSCVNKVLMDEVIFIAVGGAGKGKSAEQLAQNLITEWGIKYEMKFKLPIFHDTYSNLVSKGMMSSKPTKAPPTAPIPPHRSGSAPASVVGSEDGGGQPVLSINHYDSLSSLACQTNDYLLKLEQDLEVVVDKINLSKSIRKGLLTCSPRRDSADSHEVAMDILDFLVSCRQRLGEIIDKGAAGLLSSVCVARCIAINEELSNEIDEYEVCSEAEVRSSMASVVEPDVVRPIHFPAFPEDTNGCGSIPMEGGSTVVDNNSSSCLNSSFQSDA